MFGFSQSQRLQSDHKTSKIISFLCCWLCSNYQIYALWNYTLWYTIQSYRRKAFTVYWKWIVSDALAMNGLFSNRCKSNLNQMLIGNNLFHGTGFFFMSISYNMFLIMQCKRLVYNNDLIQYHMGLSDLHLLLHSALFSNSLAIWLSSCSTRPSLSHFAFIGVAPPQSMGSNSNSDKMDQT